MVQVFEAGLCFARALIDMGFAISPKSVAIGSDMSQVRKLRRMFEREGIRLAVHTSAEQLGHQRTHGNVRSQFHVVKKRFCKAKRRSRRVGQLARRDARATLLFKTGVVPQASFGVDHIGL